MEQAFKTPFDAGSLNLALGVVLFSIQIYLDFAGYTNIARGSALLFGVNLMVNFQRPYFATCPRISGSAGTSLCLHGFATIFISRWVAIDVANSK